MRQHHDPRLEEITARAMRSPESAREATDYRLSVGGVLVRPREIRYRAEDVKSQDAPAMACELTLAGSWPDTMEDAEVEVDVVVRDAESGREAVYPEFRGKWRDTDPGDVDTQLVAFSPGEWLNRAEVGMEVFWSGHTPKQAIRVATARIPYRRIDVRGIPDTPRLYADGPEPHEADAMRSQLLEDVRNQAQITFFDSPEGWGTAMTLPSLKTPKNPALTYVVGTHIRRGAFRARPAREGRYAAVLVFSRKPEGGRDPLKRLEVDNRGVVVPPDVVYPVEISDTTSQATVEGLRVGAETARALRFGAWEAEFETLIVDPRIVRGTTIAVEETKDERVGTAIVRVFRRWLVAITGYSRDPKTWVPTLTGTALKVAEEPVEIIARDSSARYGTRGAGIVRMPAGSGTLDWLGRSY